MIDNSTQPQGSGSFDGDGDEGVKDENRTPGAVHRDWGEYLPHVSLFDLASSFKKGHKFWEYAPDSYKIHVHAVIGGRSLRLADMEFDLNATKENLGDAIGYVRPDDSITLALDRRNAETGAFVKMTTKAGFTFDHDFPVNEWKLVGAGAGLARNITEHLKWRIENDGLYFNPDTEECEADDDPQGGGGGDPYDRPRDDRDGRRGDPRDQRPYGSAGGSTSGYTGSAYGSATSPMTPPPQIGTTVTGYAPGTVWGPPIHPSTWPSIRNGDYYYDTARQQWLSIPAPPPPPPTATPAANVYPKHHPNGNIEYADGSMLLASGVRVDARGEVIGGAKAKDDGTPPAWVTLVLGALPEVLKTVRPAEAPKPAGEPLDIALQRMKDEAAQRDREFQAKMAADTAKREDENKRWQAELNAQNQRHTETIEAEARRRADESERKKEEREARAEEDKRRQADQAAQQRLMLIAMGMNVDANGNPTGPRERTDKMADAIDQLRRDIAANRERPRGEQMSEFAMVERSLGLITKLGGMMGGGGAGEKDVRIEALKEIIAGFAPMGAAAVDAWKAKNEAEREKILADQLKTANEIDQRKNGTAQAAQPAAPSPREEPTMVPTLTGRLVPLPPGMTIEEWHADLADARRLAQAEAARAIGHLSPPASAPVPYGGNQGYPGLAQPAPAPQMAAQAAWTPPPAPFMQGAPQGVLPGLAWPPNQAEAPSAPGAEVTPPSQAAQEPWNPDGRTVVSPEAMPESAPIDESRESEGNAPADDNGEPRNVFDAPEDTDGDDADATDESDDAGDVVSQANETESPRGQTFFMQPASTDNTGDDAPRMAPPAEGVTLFMQPPPATPEDAPAIAEAAPPPAPLPPPRSLPTNADLPFDDDF